MFARMLVLFVFGTLSMSASSNALDDPPAMDRDPQCLAKKAAREAFLNSISPGPVAKGAPCPPDPADISERRASCLATSDADRIWQFITDGFEPGSSMLLKGVAYVEEKLGKPRREETADGFWDIDIFEIPRTLYFDHVTVTTRDLIADAVNFETSSGTVEPTNQIYEMLINSGTFEFTHEIRLGSSRADVEAALGLPCDAVARLGRLATRKLDAYQYSDPRDTDRARFTITLNFDGNGQVASAHWFYDSVWH